MQVSGDVGACPRRAKRPHLHVNSIAVHILDPRLHIPAVGFDFSKERAILTRRGGVGVKFEEDKRVVTKDKGLPSSCGSFLGFSP